jgi:membrane-associated phospholipid phosphatase
MIAILRSLHPVDALIIAFGFLLTLFCIFYSDVVHPWAVILLINTLTSVAIVMLAAAAQRSGSRFLRFVQCWYPAPVIFLSFKEMYVIMQSFGTRDFDQLLITIDRWMFGTDPTVWLTRVSSPALTEVLQISYASFYILMCTVGFEVYRRADKRDFSVVMFTFLYGFFLSYVGYLLVPAVGPRFTLHDFNALNSDLPGLFATNAIRDFINAGESIPKNIANPMMFAQRDAFPSGHTEMTLIVMYLAARFRLKSRYLLYAFGTLLIISTVYMRYHYVVDLLGGAAFMAFAVWTAPGLMRLWETCLRKIGEHRNAPV